MLSYSYSIVNNFLIHSNVNSLTKNNIYSQNTPNVEQLQHLYAITA